MIIGVILMIVGWLFPYKADAMVSVSPSSVFSCIDGNCNVPVILSCSPQTSDIVIATWDITSGNVNVIGTCDVLNDTDISSNVDFVNTSLGGSGSMSVSDCDTSVGGADCVSHLNSVDFLNDVGYVGSVTLTVGEQVTSGSLFHFTSPTTGEISNNPSDLLASVGTVSSDTFKSSLPYVLVFMGVSIAFYILSSLNRVMGDSTAGLKYTKPKEILDKDGKRIGYDTTGDGYHKITNKKGQEIGFEKD